MSILSFSGVLGHDDHSGPLHHSLYAQVKQEMYADLNKKLDHIRNDSGGKTPKKRGRPRKYLPSGKPIGRPRKFYPPIGDPIKFLQAASLSGFIKINDENTQISGLSSFLNPNFRNNVDSNKPPENNIMNTPEIKPAEPAEEIDMNETAKTEPGEVTPNFSCQFCGKSYKKKKHYNRHVNFECINTEPRFLCTMCSYRARRKEHLIRHLRSHIGDMMSSADYSLLSKLNDESLNDVTVTATVPTVRIPEIPDVPVTSTHLSVNNHHEQVFTSAAFGFHPPLIKTEMD